MASKKEKIGILLLIGGIVAFFAVYLFIDTGSSIYRDCMYGLGGGDQEMLRYCAEEEEAQNKIYNALMMASGLMVVIGLGLYLELDSLVKNLMNNKDEASK